MHLKLGRIVSDMKLFLVLLVIFLLFVCDVNAVIIGGRPVSKILIIRIKLVDHDLKIELEVIEIIICLVVDRLFG